MADHLYAVPSALLFRKWATLEQEKPSRKLLVKNGGSAPVKLKLHLPTGAPFELAGPSVPKGCARSGAGFELLGGASTSLTVSLHREAAPPGEAQFELTVMTRAGNLHVPFVTMEQTEEPASSQPCERRSTPSDGDELSYAAACAAGDRPFSRGKTAEQAQMLASRIAEGEITPAGCTEADELSFYMKHVRLEQNQAPKPRTPQAQVEGFIAPVSSRRSSVRGVVDGAADAADEDADEEGAWADDAAAAVRSLGTDARDVAPHAHAATAASVRLVHVDRLASGGPCAQTSAPPSAVPLVSKTACTEDDELAFYQSLMSRPRPVAGGRATDAQVAARKALKQGTYFVLADGTVCDSRGRSLGTAEEVLGPDDAALGSTAAAAADEGSSPAATSAQPPHAPPTQALLSASRHGLNGCASGACSSSAAVSSTTTGIVSMKDIKGAGGFGYTSAATSTFSVKGGGKYVRSSAPKAGRVLTEEEMQANWDALS